MELINDQIELFLVLHWLLLPTRNTPWTLYFSPVT